MQLNSKGKLAQFYHFFQKDGEDLPEDFCTYFWGMAGRAVFVFGIGGMIIYWIIQLAIAMWRHKAISGLVLLSIAFLVFVIMFIVWLNKRRKQMRFEFLDEVKSIAATKIDSVKERYCPRIEWK